MMKMKKTLAALFALTMVFGLASCGGSSSSDDTDTAEESSISTTTAVTTTTAPAETEPVETEPPKPAVPEGYELVELDSDYYGVKVSFAALNDGRFAGSEVKLNKTNLKLGVTEYAVNYYSDKEWQLKDCVKYTVRIRPNDGKSLEADLKRYKPIENSAYTGFWHNEIEDKTKCHYELLSDENSFLNGRISVDVDMFAYADWMPMDDYKKLTETMIETMQIEVLDKNGMNDAKGNFPSYSGVFTVPAKVTVAGNECKTAWTVKSGSARAEISFKNENGDPVTIMEKGKDAAKYVSSRYDDTEHYRQIQFGDCIGICNIKATSVIEGEYTLVFEKDADGNETNMTFSVVLGEKGSLSYGDIKTLFGDEAKKSELYALLDSYAEEYFKQIIRGGETPDAKETKAVTTKAETTKTETATTAKESEKEPEKTNAPENHDNNAQNNEQPAQSDYSDEQLILRARDYYTARTNHNPEFVEIEGKDGDTVSIHLYDLIDGHTSTCDWYSINRKTGKGENTTGDAIDLTAENPKLWNPGGAAFTNVPYGYHGAVLYLGTLDRKNMQGDVISEMKRVVDQSDYTGKFAFLKDIPKDRNYFATSQGSEVWMILPNSDIGWMTVFEIDPATHENKWRLTQTGNGAPIILCCNYSDIAPDAAVQITYPLKDRVPFSPYISMKDGEPTTDDEANILVLN